MDWSDHWGQSKWRQWQKEWKFTPILESTELKRWIKIYYRIQGHLLCVDIYSIIQSDSGNISPRTEF